MKINKLSVVIPSFNEIKTLPLIVDKFLKLDMGGRELEIIIIDDGSTDGTIKWLKKNLNNSTYFKYLRLENNLGKGSAIRAGLKLASGDYTIIQDADLEYEPNDILKLVKFAEDNEKIAVYGSRRLKRNHYSYLFYYLGANFITWIGNLLYHQHLTDQETCYKLIKTEIFKKLELRSNSFDIENEITAKLGRLGYQIKELPISYHPRRTNEGKKIKFRHGLLALWTLFKYFFWQPKYFLYKIDNLVLAKLRFLRVIPYIESGERILDVGCGQADFFNFLKKKNKKIDYYGIDRNINNGHNKEFILINCSLEKNLPFPTDFFDKVVVLAVIEHVGNYQNLLKEFFRILKKGGYLLLTTPSRKAKLILKLMAKLRLINPYEIYDHKQYFSEKQLEDELIKSGFLKDRIKIEKFELGLNLFGVIQK